MLNNSRRFLLTVLAVTLTAGLAACGSDSDTTTDTTEAPAGADTTSAPAAATPGTITIKDFKFSPLDVKAKVGDTITVVNADDAEHSVMAKDGSFDSTRFTRGTKTFEVKTPGRFQFQCEVHPFMDNGFIQVSP